MRRKLPVHPFPARMAPEIVKKYLDNLDVPSIVLDPMMGSGTFVIEAATRGHKAIGFDSDPLARIITAAAAGRYDFGAVRARAREISVQWHHYSNIDMVTEDPESRSFIDFWFDETTQQRLAGLAVQIAQSDPEIRDPLWCAFSRLIITKDKGASRARDVSHSRPHRVRDAATLNPISEFEKSVNAVLSRAQSNIAGELLVRNADARWLPLGDSEIDKIMTSPPYLIAIDYLRGHRLSLVWMGHTIAQLRELRGSNVGSERKNILPKQLLGNVQDAIIGEVPRDKLGIIATFTIDLDRLVMEQYRVLRTGGKLTYVVANSKHGDSEILLDKLVQNCAASHGFELTHQSTRLIPASSRYLPPPRSNQDTSLDKRMRSEVVLTFIKI